MSAWNSITICGLLLASMCAPVAAQSDEWIFDGSLYLFAAETDATVGDVKGTLSFSDALDNLDFAGMASLKATNNQWTFIGDLMYFNLGFENDRSGPLISGIDTDQKNTIFSGYALYRVYETPNAIIDLGGGFRYFSNETTITVRSDLFPTRQVGTDDDWTDPLIAAQVSFNLSDKWSSMLGVDYGSFVDDRETYSATLTFGYAFSDNWFGRLGYRYISVENKDDDVDFRFEQSGPILGVTYRF
nr:hypothetical protein [Marinicella sp. W31]MDC2877005.1 hypothetical protein [Marinicella sp. W31]